MSTTNPVRYCFCGRPLPPTTMCVQWCDECLDEWWATKPSRYGRPMDTGEFIAMKQCDCPCHAVIEPGLVPCPRCEHERKA